MFRLVLSTRSGLVRCSFPALTMARRNGYHTQTHHDFSECFTRKLTQEEESALEEQQERRKVSGVVPGKMFMRHWIAAEQSTVSVVNRVMSGIIAVFLMLWACCYATLGYNGHNCAHIAGWTFIAYWMVLHTHCMALIPAFLTVALMQLFLN